MDILSQPRSVDSGALLIEEIERTAGIISWLERKVESLDEETEFLGDVVVTTEEHGSGANGQIDVTKTETRREVTHWWKILRDERTHLANITTGAIRAGLEERRVRLAERSVSSIEAALAMILMDFGLDPHNERVRTVVGTRLRQALEAGQVSELQLVPRDEPKVITEEGTPVKPVDF